MTKYRIWPFASELSTCNGEKPSAAARFISAWYLSGETRKYARQAPAAGFTTVRSLGAMDWVDIGLRNAIVSEAHAWHRKAAAHCLGAEAAKMAIAAGVDSIEHGTFLKDDTLRLKKDKGVYRVPTLYDGWLFGQ